MLVYKLAGKVCIVVDHHQKSLLLSLDCELSSSTLEFAYNPSSSLQHLQTIWNFGVECKRILSSIHSFGVPFGITLFRSITMLCGNIWEYSPEQYRSHITLLWIWIMIWDCMHVLEHFYRSGKINTFLGCRLWLTNPYFLEIFSFDYF